MNVVIVGAGDIGCALAATLLKHKHQVTLIERDPDSAEHIIKNLNIVVITGDGTDLSMLKDAEVEKASVFIAVTPRDQDNLIACQLASSKFNVSRTIARVSKPFNVALFNNLGGITNIVSATDSISRLVEEDVADEQVVVAHVFKDGVTEVVRVKVREKSFPAGKPLGKLKLPDECVFSAVFRDGETVFPDASFEFRPGDEIVAVTSSKGMVKLGRMLREAEDG